METFFCFAKNISCTLFLSSFSNKSSILDKHIAELTISGNNRQTRLQCGQITGIPRIAYNRSSWNSATTFPRRARGIKNRDSTFVCSFLDPRIVESKAVPAPKRSNANQSDKISWISWAPATAIPLKRMSNSEDQNSANYFSHRNRELKSYRCLHERFKNVLSICN